MEPAPPLGPLGVPWTSWSREREGAFVTLPDETMTNGPSRPWGCRAGSARQMFQDCRKSRRGARAHGASPMVGRPGLVENEAVGAGRLERERG